MNIIDTHLEKIVEYYSTLNGSKSVHDFLKKELYFINEAIDLINLNFLHLTSDYISECRNIMCKSLESDNFLDTTRKLSIETINKILSIKKYTEMSRLEKNTFDCFVCLFPREIESSDLFVELFTDSMYAYGININGVNFLSVFHHHFSDIIE